MCFTHKKIMQTSEKTNIYYEKKKDVGLLVAEKMEIREGLSTVFFSN